MTETTKKDPIYTYSLLVLYTETVNWSSLSQQKKNSKIWK